MRSPAGRGHAPGAPGLPAAHRPRGPRGQKGGRRVPEGRAWAAGARRARGCASFLLPTRVRVAWPLSSFFQSRGPAGRDCSRGSGARRWPAVARYARSRRRCLIFLRRETCSAPPPRPAPPAEATPPRGHAHHRRKPPPLSRCGRAPTGCTPRIPPLPLEATVTYTTSQQSLPNTHNDYHDTKDQPVSNTKVLPAEIF